MSLERAFHKRYNRDKIMQTADRAQLGSFSDASAFVFYLQFVTRSTKKDGYL